ncbi:uncharacterized protein LOC113315772 [Papaver somniferum]|uniref:uncharacterized protein LOC113315772 n=1 Tax=Papaver somniferum TaxID=3469 RepID=UPI000E6FADC2|nr:uncharacterized protein LOC113315772 [Papaver somniferum]
MHKPPSSQFYSSNMTTVNQLIDHDSKTWKTDILNVLFDENIVAEIINIRIPIAGKDQLRWEPSSNGIFTIKSAYSSIFNDSLVDKPTKNNLDICWKSFWRYKLSQRVQHFMWKYLHGCIATKSRLSRFTRHQDNSCALCNNNNAETLQHLFFECPSMGDWTRTKSLQINNNSFVIIADKFWKAPCTYTLKINFDASHIDKSVLSSWGLICRDFAGNSYGLRGGAHLAIDPEQDKAQSLLEAVQWALKNGWRRIHLEGDCQNVIAAVNGSSTSIKWTTSNLVQDTLVLLSSFDFWACTYVHRDANHIADSLAKNVRTQAICFCWSDNMPSWVNHLIQQDKNNL